MPKYLTYICYFVAFCAAWGFLFYIPLMYIFEPLHDHLHVNELDQKFLHGTVAFVLWVETLMLFVVTPWLAFKSVFVFVEDKELFFDSMKIAVKETINYLRMGILWK